ncbi:MAG: GIY-YIG nuclease family protein [Phycisphaerae bacterium]|nr:GIY-YIG nuclease family protein [Phycisphaerae bacterium]
MYILRCRDQRYYFGSTNDLVRRLADHRAGRVRSTKPRLPVELVYFEECKTLDQARQRERSFKNGRTRRKTIDLLIRSFPRDHLAPFAGAACQGLDRWDVVVHIDYLPADDEVRLLHSRYPAVGKDLLKCMVKAAGDLRRAHANEELTTVLTTRRLLALCARLERGNEFSRALAVCVLNKVPTEDRKVIGETFEHHAGLNA